MINSLKRLHSDSLYRNSIYLMASTLVMAFLGFFFWMIVTRLYSPTQVGLATTLISVTGLIQGFSLFGLNNALIRFLPGEMNKNSLINTAFTLVSLGAILITVIFFTGLPYFSPALIFMRENLLFALSFTIFMVVAVLNSITDSVFISYRDTRFILLTNTIQSLVKLSMPVFMVTWGAFGIFYSYMISVEASLFISVVFLVILFAYRFWPEMDRKMIGKMWKYSFGNYISAFFSSIPGLVLPILITNRLGTSFTAFYYMPSMIINLLLIIPRATNQSLFAEGSHDEGEIRSKILGALKIILLLMIPSSLMCILFGKYILLAFGKNYSSQGNLFLQLSSLAALLSVPNNIMGTYMVIRKRIKTLVWLSAINSTAVMIIYYLSLPFGLPGLGVASIFCQLITSGITFAVVKLKI